MKHTFIAADEIGNENGFAVIMFDLESDKAKSVEDLRQLAYKAVHKFALTDEGAGEYAANCYNFNWGDFINCLDNETFKGILKESGLTVTFLGSATDLSSCFNYEEQLMEDIPVHVSGIEWETDGKDPEDCNLTSEMDIILMDPSCEVADVLSDETGFLVKSPGEVSVK